MSNGEREAAAIAAGAAGAVFQALTILAQVASAPVDKRTGVVLCASFFVGTVFGGLAGFYWTGTATGMLQRWFNISDPLAVAFGLGLCIVPFTPPLMRLVLRKITKWADLP